VAVLHVGVDPAHPMIARPQKGTSWRHMSTTRILTSAPTRRCEVDGPGLAVRAGRAARHDQLTNAAATAWFGASINQANMP
jgi:hypothetical protein